jgi:hypothetical protein
VARAVAWHVASRGKWVVAAATASPARGQGGVGPPSGDVGPTGRVSEAAVSTSNSHRAAASESGAVALRRVVSAAVVVVVVVVVVVRLEGPSAAAHRAAKAWVRKGRPGRPCQWLPPHVRTATEPPRGRHLRRGGGASPLRPGPGAVPHAPSTPSSTPPSTPPDQEEGVASRDAHLASASVPFQPWWADSSTALQQHEGPQQRGSGAAAEHRLARVRAVSTDEGGVCVCARPLNARGLSTT